MNEKPSYEELEKRILELEDSESKKKDRIEQLKETNRILDGVLNGIQDIIGIQNPDHTIVRYNKAGYESLNMTPTDVAGEHCYSLIGRTIPCEDCATDRALKSKKLETIERFVPELGRYFICRSNPVLDESGQVTHIIEQLHDITERKNAEEALREKEERYRLLFNMGANAMFLVDDNTTQILECNNKASQLFAYSSRAL